MTPKTKPFVSIENYLEKERKAPGKNEYYKGEVFAMAGASFNHTRINFNLTGLMHTLLKEKNCVGMSPDMRIHIPLNTWFTYPDLAVVCGKPEFLQNTFPDTLLNPSLIFEILSPSTEQYDRNQKFMLYQQIPALTEYCLVSSENTCIESFFKKNGEWERTEALDDSQGGIFLRSIEAWISLEEIYSRVHFEDGSQNGPFPEVSESRPGYPG